jgi:hypothetical protein
VANSDIIDSLIATYRNLNMTIRPLSDAQVEQASGSDGSLRDLISEMRNNELQMSQQLKLMTLGEGALTGRMPEIAPIAPGLNVRAILSEFGTAREAILALIREMSDEDWTAQREGPNGQTSIQKVVEQIFANDRKALAAIEPLIKSRAA